MKQAKRLYRTLHIVTFTLLIFAALILFTTKERILRWFTNEEGVLSLTLQIIWLNCIILFPDSYKGMIRGTIKGLGLQQKVVLINLFGHWCLNLSLLLILGFYFKLGIFGFWFAKLVLELFLNCAYLRVVIQADWKLIS